MFERFSDEARAAVLEAAEAAEATDSRRIGREHILVGLVAAREPRLREAGFTTQSLTALLLARRNRGSEADDAAALAAFGIDLDAIRERVERNLGPGAWAAGDPPARRPGLLGRLLGGSDRPPFSAGARKTLELGLREALVDRSRQITTTHLLRGLLRDPGPVATALIDSVLPVDQLRDRVAEPPAA